jgi:hypothetical protein
VPDDLLGKMCRCPRCEHKFLARRPGTKPKPFRNLQPSRGPLVLTAGIMGLVFGLLSPPVVVLGCCCPFTGLGASGIGLAFALLAAITGMVDLAQAARGTREVSRAAQVGMILGFCGIPLAFVGAAVALVWEFLFTGPGSG